MVLSQDKLPLSGALLLLLLLVLQLPGTGTSGAVADRSPLAVRGILDDVILVGTGALVLGVVVIVVMCCRGCGVCSGYMLGRGAGEQCVRVFIVRVGGGRALIGCALFVCRHIEQR